MSLQQPIGVPGISYDALAMSPRSGKKIADLARIHNVQVHILNILLEQTQGRWIAKGKIRKMLIRLPGWESISDQGAGRFLGTLYSEELLERRGLWYGKTLSISDYRISRKGGALLGLTEEVMDSLGITDNSEKTEPAEPEMVAETALEVVKAAPPAPAPAPHETSEQLEARVATLTAEVVQLRAVAESYKRLEESILRREARRVADELKDFSPEHRGPILEMIMKEFKEEKE